MIWSFSFLTIRYNGQKVVEVASALVATPITFISSFLLKVTQIFVYTLLAEKLDYLRGY